MGELCRLRYPSAEKWTGGSPSGHPITGLGYLSAAGHLAHRGGQIYVMGWQSATSKLVTSGEAAATFQSMGFADAIKLDGGGSFAFQIAQSGQKTSENRRINSVLRFGGADIQPQNPDQPNAPDYERWKSYMARWEAEKAALPASQWAQASLEQAKAKGITDGTRPRSMATWEEVALMVNKVVEIR